MAFFCHNLNYASFAPLPYSKTAEKVKFTVILLTNKWISIVKFYQVGLQVLLVNTLNISMRLAFALKPRWGTGIWIESTCPCLSIDSSVPVFYSIA